MNDQPIEKTLDGDPNVDLRDGPIWSCKIGLDPGTLAKLPPGADAPLRRIVEECFRMMFGYEADFCFSGWGGELTEVEEAARLHVIEAGARAKAMDDVVLGDRGVVVVCGRVIPGKWHPTQIGAGYFEDEGVLSTDTMSLDALRAKLLEVYAHKLEGSQ